MVKKFSDMEPFRQHSLRTWVRDYIREGILNGRYKPGDSLTETKLSKEMGVSRTPIREAMRQLELEGLVTCIPNRGVFVTGITEQDVDDIYTIRSMIEGLAVRWAVERIDEEGLKKLEEIVELMEYYTGRGDMEQVTKLDTQFHDVIYDACRSRILKQTLGNLMRNIHRVRLGSLKIPNRAQKSLLEHREILNAFLAHDPYKAEKLMIEHISQANHNLHAHEMEIKDRIK